MKEARRARSRDPYEQDVDDPDLRERVEGVEGLEARQIALDDPARQRPVLSPLHVDGGRSASTPIGVQRFAMPIRPDISRRTAGLVTHPDDLLVRGDGVRNPRAMHVITPEQVVADN